MTGAREHALSKTPREWAEAIIRTHTPGGFVALAYIQETGESVPIDDSGRCLGCQATGWRPDYILPWPCAAWNLATAVLAAE